MRLSKIKLAGFKSFVDPTTITFPSSLVGVVGPNGCGKSNVIDAVRWVMGESSASRLRGTPVRQQRYDAGRAIRQILRNLDSSGSQSRWNFGLFPERHKMPPQGHHGGVPRHRSWSSQLLDHRAGHDFAAD